MIHVMIKKNFREEIFLQVVRFDSVSKEFPGHLALDKVSFSLKKGQIHGLLGPNGAGKSTLMNILSGILPASEGRVEWPQGVLRVGFLPEHSPLYVGMQVEEFLIFAAKLKEVSPKREVARVVELCQLDEVRNRLIENLSRGYRQRVNLAQSLLNNPQLLILDEPFIGLDPSSISEMRQLFTGLKGEVSLLFSSHQLQEVENICDELTILHRGKLLASGSLQQIIRSVDTSERFAIRVNKVTGEWKEKFEEIEDVQLLSSIHEQDDCWLFELESGHSTLTRPEVVRKIVEQGGEVLELILRERHLEDVFDKMVKGVNDESL